MGDCIHKDCKYRAANSRDEWQCDYLSITGKSRLLWHRKRGLSTDPEECQCYEKGKRIKPTNFSLKPTEKEPYVGTTGRLKKPKRIGKEVQEPISVLIRKKAEETNPYKAPPQSLRDSSPTEQGSRPPQSLRDSSPAEQGSQRGTVAGASPSPTGRRGKKATKEEIRERKEMVRLGMSDREIAEACGLNLQYLRKWIQKNQIPTQKERQREKAAKGWRKLYESGMGINQIAALYHVPKQEIIRLRNEAGVPPHPRGGNHEAKREKILEALEGMEEE